MASLAASITSRPAAGQLVEHDGKIFETIREGEAYILIPPNTQTHVDPSGAKSKKADDSSLKPQNVFYNPIQQFNRDLSVLAIKAFGEDWMVRKRARGERKKANGEKNKSKKRKRTEGDVNGSLEEEEGGVKLQKAGDGSPVRVEETAGTPEKTDGTEHVDVALSAETVKTTVKSNGTAENDTAKDGTEKDHASKPAGPKFRILDALSATGLRALRYAKEIPFVTSIVANDMNKNATESMKLNIQHNDLSSCIETNTGDAIGHMYSVAYPPTNSHGPQHSSKKYDVIDLDPYGTAAPFVDAALQSLNDGGLLCVTCTDSGVFASTGYCEKTFSLYGGMPVRGPFMHEGGLRLIINSVASAAAKYGIAIEPILSLSIDFYVRVFIRIRKSPADVKFLAGKTMIVYCCDAGCGAWTTQTLGRNTKQESKNGSIWYKHTIAQAPGADRFCEHCGSKTHVGGPMWAGPLHNAAFIEKILEDLETANDEVYETKQRIMGMLTTALDELVVNDEVTKLIPAKDRRDGNTELIPKVPPETIDRHPFFVNPSTLAKVIHCQAPADAMIKGALRHAGYRATRSHCQAGSIKTDAPWTAIWEIMREWVRQKSPIKESSLKENTAGWRIMRNARKTEEGTDQAESKGSTHEITTEEVKSEAMKREVPKRIKVVFDEVLGKDYKAAKLVRYQQNPRENWGPMTKAKGPA